MDDLLGGHPVVDFSALPHAALERLAGHYGLSSRSPHLASQISAAFLAEAVDEEQVMLRLLRRCHPKKGGAARKQAPKSTARRQLGPQRTLETTPRKKSRSMTYGDMISAALRQLPARRGTLEQIYDEMEKKFGSQLNTELEAGPRQVPVWKASVRKIINLNGVRFHRSFATDAGGHCIFELAKGIS